jgi:hypothetical protein
VKFKSLTVAGTPVEGELKLEYVGRQFVVTRTVQGFFRKSVARYELSLSGAAVHIVVAGGSSSTTGAVVGGFLAGGVGAVAGSALAPGAKHLVAVQHEQATLMIEMSTKEIAELGVVPGQTAPGVAKEVIGEPKVSVDLSGAFGLVFLLILAVVGVRACSKRDAKPASGLTPPAASAR